MSAPFTSNVMICRPMVAGSASDGRYAAQSAIACSSSGWYLLKTGPRTTGPAIPAGWSRPPPCVPSTASGPPIVPSSSMP